MIITAPDSAPFVPGFTNNVAQGELDRCGFPAIGNQAPRKTDQLRRAAAMRGTRRKSERAFAVATPRPEEMAADRSRRYLPAAVISVCIDRYERRFAGCDSRLLRPKLMPRLMRFVRRFLH